MPAKPRGVCYICGSPATSDEHVPARCFFPSTAEYRRELITVRSCAAHNEDTSKDDEYVRNVIAMAYGAKATAFKDFFGKIVRSFENSAGLARSTLGTRKPVQTPDGASFAFQIDRQRFERTVRKIAYGIYFHERREPWRHELIVSTDGLRNADMSTDPLGGFAALASRFTRNDLSSGKNPRVLQYRLLQGSDSAILQLVFYDGFVVWFTPLAGSKAPSLNSP